MMRILVLACVASLSGGCVRFDTFACNEADDCVLNGLGGQCEATGYCSFPDLECASGSRYSEHAPSDLARECVDGAASSSTGADTMSGGPGTDPSDTSSESGDATDCVDLDGDGAGVGVDCQALDCDDDNPATADGCVYVGPGGDDTNPGTLDAPWRTFAHAVATLAPGDSLVALDGRYVESEVGTLIIDCEQLAASGTASAPIFVRAQNDRQAVIDREGRAYGIGVEGCENWRVRGFSITSDDNPSDADGAWRANVDVSNSTNIELRQIFANHSNRYFNEHAVFIGGSENVLLEDVEVHDFFRSGFSIWASDGVVLRRCYGNSHEVSDLPACPDLPDCADPDDASLTGTEACPKCSAGSSERGDNTFYIEHSNDVLCENCISEGSARGYQIVGGVGQNDNRAGENIRILQSLSIGDDRSVVTGANSDGIPPRSLRIEDFVALDATSTSFDISDPDGLTLRNVSIFGGQGAGVWVRAGTPANCTGGTCSVDIERTLIEGVAGDGLVFDAEPENWSVVFTNVFGSGDRDYAYPGVDEDVFDDDEGNARNNLSIAATEVGGAAGECRVYVPGSSNMFDPFGDGVAVGGSMTDALVAGVSSGEALWDSRGAFPCGPDPLEPSQIAQEQCPDLASRTGLADVCAPPEPRGP